MRPRLSRSRSIAGASAILVLCLLAGALGAAPGKRSIAYCAMMPDAIGLYVGNHVTMLGMTVGTVTDIDPVAGGVRVDFDIAAEHPLHGDVAATTVSDTLVADRNLEVVESPTSTDRWEESTCISKTVTPRSITETLTAFNELVDELGAAQDDPNVGAVGDAVSALDAATAGTGPRLNRMIRDLGDALESPDVAIGRIGEITDAIAGLSSSISINWEDIRIMLIQLGPGLDMINGIWGHMNKMVDSLLIVLNMFNDITSKYGGPILDGLNASVPYIRLLADNSDSVRELVSMLPALTDALDRSVDPESGAVRVAYAPPVLSLDGVDLQRVCDAVTVVRPGMCDPTASSMPELDPAVLLAILAGAAP